MALLIDDKKAIVAEVAEAAKNAKSAVVADSRGIPAAQMTAKEPSSPFSMIFLPVRR